MKTKKVKAYALFSKWGFHRAYKYKTFAEAEVKDGKKHDLEFYILPCTITYSFPKTNG